MSAKEEARLDTVLVLSIANLLTSTWAGGRLRELQDYLYDSRHRPSTAALHAHRPKVPVRLVFSTPSSFRCPSSSSNDRLGGCIYDDGMASDLKHAYGNGFQIGSHTRSHKDLATLSRDESELCTASCSSPN